MAAGTPLRGAHELNVMSQTLVRVVSERGFLLQCFRDQFCNWVSGRAIPSPSVAPPMHAGAAGQRRRWPFGLSPVMVSFVRGFPKSDVSGSAPHRAFWPLVSSLFFERGCL